MASSRDGVAGRRLGILLSPLFNLVQSKICNALPRRFPSLPGFIGIARSFMVGVEIFACAA